MTTNEQIQKQNEAACTSVALHDRDFSLYAAEVLTRIFAVMNRLCSYHCPCSTPITLNNVCQICGGVK